jgi:hypothetical protein
MQGDDNEVRFGNYQPIRRDRAANVEPQPNRYPYIFLLCDALSRLLVRVFPSVWGIFVLFVLVWHWFRWILPSVQEVICGSLWPWCVARLTVAWRACVAILCFWRGPVKYLTPGESQHSAFILAARDGFAEQDDLQDPDAPAPPIDHRLPAGDLSTGRYAVSVSMALKAEGLGSMGEDTAAARRICMLRACEIMRKHGVRSTHIARSAPLAVALAFTPLRQEIDAKRFAIAAEIIERLNLERSAWVDPSAQALYPARPGP